MTGEIPGDEIFDELIHAPKRLRICAMLAASAGVEFGTLRDALKVSDSVLSKHLSALEDAGYVTTSREVRHLTSTRRPRVWATLTPAGRRAYTAHVRALQQIVRMDGHTPLQSTSRSGTPAPDQSPSGNWIMAGGGRVVGS